MTAHASAGNTTIVETAGLLRGFAFFRDCPEDFFVSLAGVTELRCKDAGQPILEEGQINEHLYFLLSGTVEIYVQGERVAKLERAGDILGEISLITSRPASATIRAMSDVEYLAISSRQLEELTRTSREFGYHLFRTYSLALSDKMVLTNDKARKFEIANRALLTANQALEESINELDRKVRERTRDLQVKTDELERSYQAIETRSAELEASHRKLEELYFSKDITFKRLGELHNDHLLPLKDSLGRIEPAIPETERPRIQRVRAEVESSLERLGPLTSLYSTEQMMRSRRVLLAEPDRKQQVIAKLALGGTGVQLDIAASDDELVNRLESGAKFDLIFFSPDLASHVSLAASSQPGAKLVFMASSEITQYLPILRANPLFTNIVSRNAEDRTFTVKSIMTTVSKMISRDLFGLEKYLIWGVETQSRDVNGSDDRAQLIEEMRERLASLGVRNRITDRAALVSEELLMNAIYDAPLGTDGRPLYNHLPRTQPVALEPGQRSQYRYACDGMLAAVSVTDPFGGFHVNILLDYLERNYSGGQTVQTSGKGGAGRGLHQIIESSDLVIFNVKRNVRTEVIALFNLDLQGGGEETHPSFHFFLG